MEIARFEKRVISYLIDLVFPYAIGITSGVLLFVYTPLPWYFSLLLLFLFCFVAYLLVNVPAMGLSKGHGIGSAITGIKTINENGSPITWKAVWIKNLYYALLPCVIANAIYMLIIHTERTLFDRITDTVVVDERIKN
mgnify:CR=1 FL=1